MLDPIAVEGRITILNVGTRILLKDIMDAYLRSLGDYKTLYARDMASALRIFKESQVHIVISEVELPDGSAYRLLRELGGPTENDDLYFIVALEEKSDALLALVEETEADATLVKPFSASDLRVVMERYTTWKVMPKEPWRLFLSEAHHAYRDKRYSDVDAHYRDAIGAAPSNPVPLFKAAAYYLVKPDYALAEKLLKKALELRPGYVQAISMLGSLYFMQHDLDRADECFKRAQVLSPLNPDRGVEIVRLCLERCIEASRGSIRVDPNGTAAKLLLAKLMTIQKDYTGAVRELDKLTPLLRGEVPRLEAQTFAALARKLGNIAK